MSAFRFVFTLSGGCHGADRKTDIEYGSATADGFSMRTSERVTNAGTVQGTESALYGGQGPLSALGYKA